MIRSRFTTALAAACVIALLPFIGTLDLNLQRMRISNRVPIKERYYLPPPRVLRAMSLGYNEFFADLLWVRTIAYFTSHLFTDRDLQHLKQHLDNILALDPYFKEIYRYGSSMLMSLGERQRNEDVFDAIDLLKRAHHHFPSDYRFPMHAGSYYISELKSDDRAKRAAWRSQGADWVNRAAMLPGAPPWLPALAAKIYTKEGKRELAVLHLREILSITQDPDMKKNIRGKLRELQDPKLHEIQDQTNAFASEHLASTTPFVHPDLYALIRPPTQGFRLVPKPRN